MLEGVAVVGGGLQHVPVHACSSIEDELSR